MYVRGSVAARIASDYALFARRVAARLLMLAAVMFIAGLSASKASAQTDVSPAPTSLIVKLVAGLTIDQQAAVIARNGGVETSSVPALRLHIVEVGADQIDQGLARYQSDSQVARVEINAVRQSNALPTDPRYPDQWSLPRIGWDQVFGTFNPNSNVVVAVLDTGIDASHPDLFGNVMAGTSILDGSNGMTDPSGHGTMVAGTVAASTNNAVGIAGVAYAGVRLMPVTVLNADGLGTDSDIINGVIWASDHGADVILMAFSNPGFSASLQEAIDYAWSNNVVLVAANGNDGANAPTFPAGDRGVIGVSATDENDQLASFSNYGTSVFLAAPGTNVLTTDVGGNYISISGTSSSAAIVAGAAAQMMAIDPSASNGVIVGRLARNADPAGTQEQTGNGRVNLARALLDAGTGYVQPAGAAPVGTGGPFVGPYVAAATNINTITSLSALSTPLSAGQTNVPFSGTVTLKNSGDPAIPAGGTVQLLLSSGANCTGNPTVIAAPTLSANGAFSGTFTAPSAAGSYSFQAQYQGASQGSGVSGTNWQKSSSACQTITVNAQATTTLAASNASSTYGSTVNLSATLTSGGSAVNGKTIAFSLNGASVGSATTNALGIASLANVGLGTTNAGTYPNAVSASFAGDSGFASSSASATLTVAQAPSSTGITCPVSVTYTGAAQAPCSAAATGVGGLNQSVTVSYTNNVNAGTATATATYNGDANHTGSTNSTTFAITQAPSTTKVTCPASVTYNGTPQTPCTVSVTGANLNLTPTPTYTNNVNAGSATASYTYVGDSNHTGSQDSKTFTIDKATSATSLSSSNNPATADDNVSFTASVTSGATGTVQFIVNGTNYGSPVTLSAAGTATIAFTNKTAGTYTIRASYSGDNNFEASAADLSPAQQITAGAPATLSFGTQPTDTQAGQAIIPPVTVRILDAEGNQTSDTSSVTIAIGGGGALQAGSTTTVAAVGGIATFDNLKPTRAGSFTLRATDGTLTAADSSPFNVTPGAAVTFAFDVPASITAGQSFDITVYAADTFDNVATGYTGTVHFTSTDANASLPSDVQFVAADAGVKSLPLSTTLTTAGNQKITATDTGPSGIKGTSPSIAVNPGNATVLIVSGPAAIETAGVPFNVTVEARDKYDNTATSYAGKIHFDISDPKAATLNDYTFLPGTDNGIHSFAVTLHSAGQWTVKATDLADNISGESGTITLQPGAPAKLAFKSQPGNTFVGVAVPSFEVDVHDADDNVVDNANGNLPITIAIGVNPTGAGVLGGTVTVNAVNGVATFSGLMLNKAATGYTLVATSDPLTSATSNPFDVGKGTATLSLADLNQTYDGLPKSATVATTPAGLSGVSVTYNGSSTPPTNAGSYAIIASLDNPDYQATNATGTLVVAKADAKINVTPYSVTYDGNAHTAAGTATGVKGEALNGLDVTGTTHTNASDYPTDSWTFTDTTGNYNNAAGTVHDVISKASAKISVTPYNVTYDGNVHTATGTALGVKGEALSGLDLAGTAHTSAGTYTDQWKFADATGNYNDANGTVQDAITKANAKITVTGYSVTYDGNPHTATGTATGAKGEPLSGLDVSSTTHTNVGTYTDSWKFTDATGNYNDASGTVPDAIGKADAKITVTPYSVTYDGTAHVATGTVVGVKGESLSGLNLSATAHTDAGDYAADPWSFIDSIGNYNNASGIAHDMIGKASSTVTVTGGTYIYDANPHPASAIVSGVGSGITQTVNWSYTPPGDATMPINAGTYSAVASYAGDANHLGSYGLAVITIAPAPSTTSVSAANAFFDSNPHGATAGVTGVGGLSQALTVTYTGISGTSYGPSTTPPTAVGVYQADAGYAGDNNHLTSKSSTTFNIVDISVSGPTDPIAKGNAETVTMKLVGAASAYPVSCSIDWNDGTTSTATGSGSCSATHTYAAAGVYQPTVTVKSDSITGTSTGNWQYVVIYDASAGFVTGGGWIMSPPGAYTADATLTGKANFGFNSKYQKGANVPSGDTQFQFQAGNLNFKSTSYQWLVIAGAKAQYKGNGTINGAGNYQFILTAIDGSINGGGGVDKFRIKIMDSTGATTIYDNQVGASDTSDTATPVTALGGGSIVIHN